MYLSCAVAAEINRDRRLKHKEINLDVSTSRKYPPAEIKM